MPVVGFFSLGSPGAFADQLRALRTGLKGEGFEEGGNVESGDLVPASDLLRRIGEVPGLARIMDRLHMDGSESFGQAAAALEFALEGLYLMRRLSKDVIDGGAIYRT